MEIPSTPVTPDQPIVPDEPVTPADPTPAREAPATPAEPPDAPPPDDPHPPQPAGAQVAGQEQDEAEDGGGFRPTVLMERVSRWLEPRTEPASRKAIEDNVPGRGQYVRQAIEVGSVERETNVDVAGQGRRTVHLGGESADQR